MAKYCEKCGIQNPDKAKFCEGCGEIINKEIDLNEPNFTSKVGTIGFKKYIFAVVALLLVVLSVFTFSGRSYKATVHQFHKALTKPDAEAFLNLLPKGVIDELDEKLKELGYEIYDEYVDILNRYFALYAEDMSYCKVESAKNVPDSVLAVAKYSYGKIGVDVSAVKLVEFTETVIVSGEKQSDTYIIPLIKVGWSWYVPLDISMLTEML